MERLSIPPEFSSYAEDKGIFMLYEGTLQALLKGQARAPAAVPSVTISLWTEQTVCGPRDSYVAGSAFSHVCTTVLLK